MKDMEEMGRGVKVLVGVGIREVLGRSELEVLGSIFFIRIEFEVF